MASGVNSKIGDPLWAHMYKYKERLATNLVPKLTRAQLFKTNDVLSLRDVQISNILYIKTLPFFADKMSTLDFRRTRRRNESLTNDFVKLTML